MQGKVTTEEAMAPVYAGIDVCKERLDIHLHPLGESFGVANDAAGRRHLLRRLAKAGVVLVAMEPTSTYHRACHRHLAAGGIAVALVNPLRSRLFAEACGALAKTDAIDARMLALLAERLEPDATVPPSPIEEELQELAGARGAAVAEKVALINRMETTSLAFLRRELTRRIASLARHIERIEARIEALVATDPALVRRAAILRSIPGIGPVGALAILAWLREIGRICSKQAAALAGLAPFARDSGPAQNRRSIRGGRAELRRYLYMAALATIRCNPNLKRFYQHLRANGKPAKLAITAVARKLVVLANTLVREDRLWTAERP